jgi:hypothetical protein
MSSAKGREQIAVLARCSLLRARQSFMRVNWGDAGVTRYYEALPDAVRQHLDGTLRDEWLPIEHLVEATVAIDRLFGTGDLALVWEIGRHSGRMGRGEWTAFAIRHTPLSIILKLAHRVWRYHFTAGRFVSQSQGSAVRISIEDFPTPHRAICLAVGGWAEATVELGPRDDIVVKEMSCAARGDPSCIFEARWTDR